MQSTHGTREQQADNMMNRFLATLQEISVTIRQQAQENAAMQKGSEKVLGDLGSAMENLVNRSANSAESNIVQSANRPVDLVEFTGTDRTMWPTWEIQARGKAKSCGLNPEAQFYAIFNKLKDNAAKNVTPWASRHIADGTATYEGLLEELGRLYNDPAQQAKALSSLKSMRQREKESFANFFPKFEKELANAGGVSFQDSIKVMFLKSAINSKFRNCLPKTKHYDTYEDLVSDLQNVAANLLNEEALAGKWTLQQASPLVSGQIGNDTPVPMDWTPTTINQGRINSNYHERPRASWVSKDTLMARRQANCCMRCGNSQHYQKDCPYRPPINPNLPAKNNQRVMRNVDPALLMAEPEIGSVMDRVQTRDMNEESEKD